MMKKEAAVSSGSRPIRRITQVEPLAEWTVRLRFDDGKEKTVDLTPYLHGPIFQALRDDDAGFRAVRVDHELGVLVWPNGADVDAQVLYYDDLLPAEWEPAEPARQETHPSRTRF
jgi:hypothetical protein